MVRFVALLAGIKLAIIDITTNNNNQMIAPNPEND